MASVIMDREKLLMTTTSNLSGTSLWETNTWTYPKTMFLSLQKVKSNTMFAILEYQNITVLWICRYLHFYFFSHNINIEFESIKGEKGHYAALSISKNDVLQQVPQVRQNRTL